MWEHPASLPGVGGETVMSVIGSCLPPIESLQMSSAFPDFPLVHLGGEVAMLHEAAV